MKRKELQLQIPEPCHEKWDSMTKEEKGAFCSSCAKVVIDFSKMSDREIINYFENKKNEKICGRFKSNQINTPLYTYESDSIWYKRFKQFALGFLISVGLPNLIKASPKQVFEQHADDKKNEIKVVEVKGCVTDNNKKPIKNAEIELIAFLDEIFSFKTMTDSTGNYKMEVALEVFSAVNEFDIRVSQHDYFSIRKTFGNIDMKENEFVFNFELTEFPEEVFGRVFPSLYPPQITYTLIDSATKEPVPFATVFLKDKNDLLIQSATSDFDGHFTLEYSPEITLDDSISIKVHCLGYENKIITDVLKKEILLEHNKEGLHKVGEVVATKKRFFKFRKRKW